MNVQNKGRSGGSTAFSTVLKTALFIRDVFPYMDATNVVSNINFCKFNYNIKVAD